MSTADFAVLTEAAFWARPVMSACCAAFRLFWAVWSEVWACTWDC